MKYHSFKTISVTLILFLSLVLTSCFQEPDGIGFLSDEIYLKGSDTLYIELGGKGHSNYAWLDASSQPVKFSIENIRNEAGERSEQFFQKYTYRVWQKPYDFLKDKTLEDLIAKLTDIEMEPIIINPTNGQLLYTEITSKLSSAEGSVYHVDVRVTNPKGSKVIKDYAVLKLTTDSKRFVVTEVINGIAIVLDDYVHFPLYDKINETNPNFIERRNNIYSDNGKEFVRIHKVSDEPKTGVKVIFKLIDQNGKLFNPAKYSTYSVGTYSYIDQSINRQDTEQGMIVEFPTTPWPVDANFMSYLKGPVFNNFNNLNINQLSADYLNGAIPTLVAPEDWPKDNWAKASAWYVRIRSVVTFYESGTWEFSCKIPYSNIE
ncbi:hypothetical protein MASR2M117_22220 [Paludibacter sp.]